MVKQIYDGEWVWPRMHSYKIVCCDCGLIHEMDFVVVDEETGVPLNGGAIMFRSYRKDSKKKGGKKRNVKSKLDKKS